MAIDDESGRTIDALMDYVRQVERQRDEAIVALASARATGALWRELAQDAAKSLRRHSGDWPPRNLPSENHD